MFSNGCNPTTAATTAPARDDTGRNRESSQRPATSTAARPGNRRMSIVSRDAHQPASDQAS
jgi:hypothetical protein